MHLAEIVITLLQWCIVEGETPFPKYFFGFAKYVFWETPFPQMISGQGGKVIQ